MWKDRITRDQGDGLASLCAPSWCIEECEESISRLTLTWAKSQDAEIGAQCGQVKCLLLKIINGFWNVVHTHGARRGKKHVYFRLWPKSTNGAERYQAPSNHSLTLLASCVVSVTSQGKFGIRTGNSDMMARLCDPSQSCTWQRTWQVKMGPKLSVEFYWIPSEWLGKLELSWHPGVPQTQHTLCTTEANITLLLTTLQEAHGYTSMRMLSIGNYEIQYNLNIWMAKKI